LFFHSITQPKVGFELCFIFNQRNLWVSRKSRGKNQFFFFWSRIENKCTHTKRKKEKEKGKKTQAEEFKGSKVCLSKFDEVQHEPIVRQEKQSCEHNGKVLELEWFLNHKH
jgi:hypothetical protein